ncbi:MAG: hypothetical protein Q8P25_04740, partial [Candidatus Curtissbacteria bacterium]|nr:hypothetical protein [Candidatus Curtissbacteria bacterium]
VTKRFIKQDGFVDLEKPPQPETFDRMVRAFFPWPTVWTQLDRKIIKFLPEGKIQPEGKKPMTIKEFLNGYPQAKETIERLNF